MADTGERLVRQATALAAEGKLVDAARDLRAAAAVHRRAGRRDDEVRCLVLLAQCRRLAGNVAGAAAAIERAERLAPADGAAAAERAEVDLARGDPVAAIAALDRAIDLDPPAVVRAALLRRRGITHAATARLPVPADAATTEQALAAADRDLAAAAEVFAAAGDARSARRVLVERATAVHGGPLAAAASAQARAAVDGAGDRALAGELDLLDGATAVADGRLADAETMSRRARERALAAVEPTLYVGASLALSHLADLRGDPVGAYEALAVGCATLGDLIGRDGAVAVFQPHLTALEQQWGAPAFTAARAAYEHRRRSRPA